MTNPTEFKSDLLKNEICYLSTCDKNGIPHIKPIWFVYFEGKVYFETHLPTKAYRNLKENNRVSICFGGRDTYIVNGSVVEYKESELKIPFRKLLWEKYPNDMDDSYIHEKTRLFEVVIDKELGWQYAPNWEDVKF